METMNMIYEFIGADPHQIDPTNILVQRQEADSYYMMKYPHEVFDSIRTDIVRPPIVSERLARKIVADHGWYFDSFYPKLAEQYR